MPFSGSSRAGTHSDNKGRKRPGRVPVSCAECRRLKLRCDRKVPCETCVKRSCAELCPTEVMQTGKSNRNLAVSNSNTDEMLAKVERLTARVHELEDTLRRNQTQRESLPAQVNLPDPTTLSLSAVAKNEEEDFLNAFGTLSLGLTGDANFFGNTARSEYLVHAQINNSRPRQFTSPHLSQEILDASSSFGLGGPELDEELRSKIIRLLPPVADAKRLCEIYLHYGQYIWNGIPREELFDEVLSPSYDDLYGSDTVECSHRLALLYAVFSLATLFDMNLVPCSNGAEEYFVLSRASLWLAGPIIHTTPWSIHILLHMTHYLELTDCQYSHQRSSQAWFCIGLAVRLSHSIGLHVNSGHWNLDPQVSKRRSTLFWQLFVKDVWMSFSFGRPPGTSPEYVDCEYSQEKTDHYHSWMIGYSKLLHSVMITAFGAIKPSYQVILALDRRIRDFPVISKARLRYCEVEDPPPTLEVCLYRWLSMSAKEATLVHLHRPYFAQALYDRPQDVLKHQFAPSVVSIFRSALRLIEGVLATFERAPQLMSRVRICWSHALAAAIVMCLIVTRAPTSSFAGPALQELEKLCAGLEDVCKLCAVVQNNLDVVKKLRDEGQAAMKRLETPTSTLMELDRLGGKSQVVATEEFASVARHSTPSASSTRSATQVSENPALWSFDNLHPTVLDDWKRFSNNIYTISPLSMFDDPSNTPHDTNILRGPEGPAALFNFPGQFGCPDGQRGVRENDHISTVAAAVNSMGPLILDPSFQSFVEQLGF